MQPVDTGSNERIGLGWGDGGVGWRWGKGGKVETTVNSIKNKTKTKTKAKNKNKKEKVKRKCFIVNCQLIQTHVFIFHMILVKTFFTLNCIHSMNIHSTYTMYV